MIRIPSAVLIVMAMGFYGYIFHTAATACQEKLQSLSIDQPVTITPQGESSEESSEGRSKLQDR